MVYLPKEYKNLFPAVKQHKYKAELTGIDGVKFASKREAKRYQELKLQEHCGFIKNLELQPVFVLQDSFKHNGDTIRAIKYIADFRYEKKGEIIVEDSKGFKTKEYLIKKKLLLKRYPEINFVEV